MTTVQTRWRTRKSLRRHTHTYRAIGTQQGSTYPLTPAPNHTQIILPSPIQHTRAAERAVGAVSEPFNLTGKPSTKFIDAPWVCTHAPNPGADTSSAIVSAGKGPQETLDRESEIRTWGGAGADGGAELHASQAPQEEDDDGPDKVEDEEEPQEEDDDDQAKVEDEEESATVEWESEGEKEMMLFIGT